MKYKVGDKVRVKDGLKVYKEYGGEVFVAGMEGYKVVTIRAIVPTLQEYRVKENKFFYTDEMLAGVIPGKKLVITSDSKTTTAKLYEYIDGKRVVKSATAICSDDDEFNFLTGARIAFDRLLEAAEKMNVPEQKPLFVPHMELLDDTFKPVGFCGAVGIPTPYTDSEGTPLHIGDVVEVIGKTTNQSCGLSPIVEYHGEVFPRICSRGGGDNLCDDHWYVRKLVDWARVTDGARYNDIVYRLTEGK